MNTRAILIFVVAALFSIALGQYMRHVHVKTWVLWAGLSLTLLIIGLELARVTDIL